MTIIVDEFVNLVRMQRPYIQGQNNHEVFENYLLDVEQDYNDIKDYLRTTKNLVDLGAGMGGIDYLIKQRLPNINITAMDGEQVIAGEHYGYKTDLQFYSNNSVAEQFFKANGLDVTFVPAADELCVPCDTLISLNSWGFHYPINRYTRFVAQNKPHTIILDIRIGQQDLADLENLGYQYQSTLRTWGTKKARTVLFDPLSHVCPLSTSS
jgi:hypothetical protein